MSNPTWTPLVVTARRIAGRLLRTSRAGHLPLEHNEIRFCVSAITNKFLSSAVRQKMGIMWMNYGAAVIASGAEDPERRSCVDDSLDALVLPGDDSISPCGAS